MSFPATTLLDSFIRAPESPLGLVTGQWTLYDSALTGAIEEEAFHSLHGTENTSVYYWNGEEFTEPAVCAEVHAVPLLVEGGELELWICLKVGAKEDGYRLQLVNKGTGFLVERRDNGTLYELGKSYGLTEVEVGDKIGFQALAGKVVTWLKRGAGAWEVIREDADATYTTGYVAVGVIGHRACWRNFEAEKAARNPHLPPIEPPAIVGARHLVIEHPEGAEGSCAFPGSARVVPSGEVLAVYRRGTSHTSKDGVIVAKRSTDGGETWGSEYTIAKSARSETDCREAGATVLSDGSVLVTFLETDNVGGYQVMRCIRSTDEGATFGPFITIPTNFTFYVVGGKNMGGAISAPVIEQKPGHLIVGTHGCNTGQNLVYVNAATAVSTDFGKTWSTGVTIVAYDGTLDYEEPCIVRVKEYPLKMKLLCALRSDVDHKIRTTESTDEGATWSVPVVAVTGGTGRPAIFQSKDGGLVLMQRDETHSGRPVFHYSSDFGVTWSSAITIDTEEHSHVYGEWYSLPDVEDKSHFGLVYGMQYGEALAKIYARQFTAFESIEETVGAPELAEISEQKNSKGKAITPLTIIATNTETYEASGLPAGLTIKPLTGKIEGTPEKLESTKVKVTVKGAEGEAEIEFEWIIEEASGSKENVTYMII